MSSPVVVNEQKMYIANVVFFFLQFFPFSHSRIFFILNAQRVLSYVLTRREKPTDEKRRSERTRENEFAFRNCIDREESEAFIGSQWEHWSDSFNNIPISFHGFSIFFVFIIIICCWCCCCCNMMSITLFSLFVRFVIFELSIRAKIPLLYFTWIEMAWRTYE